MSLLVCARAYTCGADWSGQPGVARTAQALLWYCCEQPALRLPWRVCCGGRPLWVRIAVARLPLLWGCRGVWIAALGLLRRDCRGETRVFITNAANV